MPYVNPNKMRNVSAAGSDIRAQKIPKKPKIAPTRGLQAPGQDKMDQISAVQDPAERYKASLNTLAQQMGNNKGNTGLRFNTGQQEWLQSLNPADQMKELLAAFSRQRPRFGQQPMHNAGVPSPVGPQPMLPNEQHQAPPSGGIMANPYGQSGFDPMTVTNHALQSQAPGIGGVPSPLGGGMHSMNGGGYQAPGNGNISLGSMGQVPALSNTAWWGNPANQAELAQVMQHQTPPQMQNPYGMQGMNGGGYQAPPSNQNPFMLSLMRMLGRG